MTKNTPLGPLFLRTAQQLERFIEEHPSPRLPTVSQLSDRFGVSLRTMLKAVNVLKDKGLLEVAPGRGIRLRRQKGTGDSEARLGTDSSSERFYALIKRQTADGTYRVGQALPKIKYFVLTEHLSEGTICKALKKLEVDAIIHKQGMNWIVGPLAVTPQRPSELLASYAHCGVVLIIGQESRLWYTHFWTHLRAFALEFGAELARHGIRTSLGTQDEQRVWAEYFPNGRKEVLEYINTLGERYRGTLFLTATPSAQDTAQSVNWLTQFKKPVVWFDDADSLPSLDRRAVPRNNYFRCHTDEPAAVRLVLHTLQRLGHQHVMVPLLSVYKNVPWFKRRSQLLRRTGADLSPPVNVHFTEQEERQWPDWGVVHDYTMLYHRNKIRDDLKAQHPKAARNIINSLARETLLKQFPSLTAAMQDGKCTAVIGANQQYTLNYYYFYVNVGLDIPHDLSLLSFDNDLQYSHHPLSTVDHHISDLGYRCAHIFIDDIPVKTDRWGNLASRPWLTDRGSLGTARR